MTKPKSKQGYFWFRVEFNRHAFEISNLTMAERGLYQHLMWMDCGEQKIQVDLQLLAKNVKVKPKLVHSMMDKIGHKFVQIGDRMHHVDVADHKAEAEARSAQATKAVSERWNKQRGADVSHNAPGQGPAEGYGRNTDVPHDRAESESAEGYGRNTSKVEYSKEDQVPYRSPSPSPQDPPPPAPDSPEFLAATEIPWDDDTTYLVQGASKGLARASEGASSSSSQSPSRSCSGSVSARPAPDHLTDSAGLAV